MLGFKQLQLSDKPILNRYLNVIPNRNSDTSFTNLYMWRRSFAVRWAVIEDHLIIEPDVFEGRYILPPYGRENDDEQFTKAILAMAKSYREDEQAFVIRGATEREKARIRRLLPGRFVFYEAENINDYVYLGENLRELKGRKYSKKRNHLNAFLKNWPDYQYETVNANMVPEVFSFIERWMGERNQADEITDSLLAEREAIFDALQHFEELDYAAGIIRIDGEIVAFTMGELVAPDTVVIHIEKADAAYRGLYVAINKLYLQHEWPTVKYVNREEDMGVPGLRKAKQSYYPIGMIHKYTGVWVDD